MELSHTKSVADSGGGDDVKDPALDWLSIIHTGLSEIISQIDELVSKGIEHKPVDKMDSGDTESFIQFLTDTHLSLKIVYAEQSWVPRFQNAFGGKTQSDETSIDNATDAFDEFVSPSPLVSPWWADNCKVEDGKQLFLLTPLPRSKQPPKTVSRLCGPNFLKCSGKKIIHMTPSSIVRLPPLPSARKFPFEGVDVVETVEANATTKTKKIILRKGTHCLC
ncbi:hypothetical protein ZOSMA_78G00890 [Zostera marina]|uniref:Uncharacterized protein n=1 Tax=Zostera marina TaxID=29655 RepID=A0A0K9NNX5_ZOSMR|nr:hypothetical protein ZOSMA_78G00890 [Zostera marina]